MTDITTFAQEYFEKLKAGLDCLDMKSLAEIIEVLQEAQKNKRWIFILGNGGSAATSGHLVNDLNKLASNGPNKFKAMGLTDNVSILTAWANDLSYDEVFVRQLDNLLSEKDVVIVITGSGNSPNVIKAIEFARERGATTIGFLGFKGGKARDLLDHYLLFDEEHYGRVEDAQSIMCHLIANYLKSS